MGPVSLSQLLSNANQKVSELKEELREKQSRLDRMTTMYENERNERLTAQSFLDFTEKQLKQSEISLKTANDRISFLEREISKETGALRSNVRLDTSGNLAPYFIEGPSPSSPSARSGRKEDELSILPDALLSQTDREATTSHPTSEGHRETTQQELSRGSTVNGNSSATAPIDKQAPEPGHASDSSHTAEKTCLKKFAAALRDTGDAMKGELKACLSLFNNLEATLNAFRGPGEEESPGALLRKDQWHCELSSAKRNLLNLTAEVEGMMTKLLLDRCRMEGVMMRSLLDQLAADVRTFRGKSDGVRSGPLPSKPR